MSGLRPAAAGEFARRAFENGKLDLTEIEGLADLINAETQAQRRQALRQTEGVLGALYDGWRSELIAALAHVEAALDFSDEADVPEEVSARARPAVEALAREIASHLDDRNRGERLRDGFRVLLAGPPNAGKSSLLNALARRDAAIVSEAPGTTRDVIEVHLDLAGYPVTVMDTAGIRKARGEVEREGVARTFARAEDADLIVWLVDATAPVWDVPDELRQGGAGVVTVLNKIDLERPEAVKDMADQVVDISAKTGMNISALTATIEARAIEGLGAGEAPSLTRARHRGELESAREALVRFLEGPPELELRAEDLRQAVQALGRITGRVDVEDVLDRIFAEFCIGK
jgi:tRNA modification GTPase